MRRRWVDKCRFCSEEHVSPRSAEWRLWYHQHLRKCDAFVEAQADRRLRLPREDLDGNGLPDGASGASMTSPAPAPEEQLVAGEEDDAEEEREPDLVELMGGGRG